MGHKAKIENRSETISFSYGEKVLPKQLANNFYGQKFLSEGLHISGRFTAHELEIRKNIRPRHAPLTILLSGYKLGQRKARK